MSQSPSPLREAIDDRIAGIKSWPYVMYVLIGLTTLLALIIGFQTLSRSEQILYGALILYSTTGFYLYLKKQLLRATMLFHYALFFLSMLWAIFAPILSTQEQIINGLIVAIFALIIAHGTKSAIEWPQVK